jgi:GTP-binding protein
MVDLGAEGEGREPLKDWTILNRELKRYSAPLSEKPQILVATKVDLTHAREKLPAFVAAMKKKGIAVMPLSAATGEGLQALLDAIAVRLAGKHETRTSKKVKPKTSKKVTKAKKARA